MALFLMSEGWANVDAGLVSYLGQRAERRGACLDDLTLSKGIDTIPTDSPARFGQLFFMRNRYKTSIPMSPSVSEHFFLSLPHLLWLSSPVSTYTI